MNRGDAAAATWRRCHVDLPRRRVARLSMALGIDAALITLKERPPCMGGKTMTVALDWRRSEDWAGATTRVSGAGRIVSGGDTRLVRRGPRRRRVGTTDETRRPGPRTETRRRRAVIRLAGWVGGRRTDAAG
mmetsp:Transcript_31560/g.94777  ORF Transcript_31560/g.94777 Transcript_31560/m.94777 type:complete len:132 (+) Transcript_31560:2-397(+)